MAVTKQSSQEIVLPCNSFMNPGFEVPYLVFPHLVEISTRILMNVLGTDEESVQNRSVSRELHGTSALT